MKLQFRHDPGKWCASAFQSQLRGISEIGQIAQSVLQLRRSDAVEKPSSLPRRFVGLAEFDMDGRAFTGGEMDRMMMSLWCRAML